MTWEVGLGGRFTVKRDGLKLGPPPTRLAGVLFCGLLQQNGEWMSRSEIEDRLYPESDTESRKAALRQTLSRMKQWLGEDVLSSSHGCVKITTDKFTLDLTLNDGSPARFSQIAPGFDHPWMDELRATWSPKMVEIAKPRFRDLVQSILHLGGQDALMGRSMLLSSSDLFDHMSARDLAQMLTVTAPKSGREPLAAEHLAARSSLAFRSLAIHRGQELGFQAWQLAQKKKQLPLAATMASWLMFYATELGDRVQAREWLSYVDGAAAPGESKLLSINALMCFHWNWGNFGEAERFVRQGLKIIHAHPRRAQIHFYTNCSAFYSEGRQHRAAEDCLLQAESLLMPELDLDCKTGIQHAQVKLLPNIGRPEEALRVGEELAIACRALDNPVHGLYASEGEARALAFVGRTRESAQVWDRLLARRAAVGSKPTTRLKRLRAAS